MNLPAGAKAVVEARMRGFKPAELLIVSLIGPTGEANHTIHASPKGEYDWRWMVGLDACLYVKPGIDWKPIAMQIAKARPNWLGVYDADRFQGADVHAWPMVEDIGKAKSQWRYRLHFFPWAQVQNEAFAWEG